jgi:hypothetical protein
MEELLKALRESEENILSAGYSKFRKEIEKDKYDDPSLDPVEFAIPANDFGATLIWNFHYELAERFFGILAAQTIHYRESTGRHRHAGSFYANQGAARALMGDMAGAFDLFERAAAEDKKSSGTDREKTFAMTTMFDSYVGDYGLDFAVKTASSVDGRIGLPEIKVLCDRLGNERPYFLTVLHEARLSEKTDTSKIQKSVLASERLNILRRLGILLEAETRNLYGVDEGSILIVFQNHKGRGTWFDDFDNRRKAIKATKNNPAPVEDQMKDALSTPTSSDEEKFWQSLLVGYVIRNYTAHQTEVDDYLAIQHFKEGVGHVVNALYWLPNYK